MNVKPWDDIRSRINALNFSESFDMVIAIANGGIIPAALINQKLQLPIHLLKLSFRDAKQQIMYDAPRLLAKMDFKVKGKNILLVEDRVKTGATLQYAKELMKEALLIKTFAVNGKADYALYDEACFSFPWIVK